MQSTESAREAQGSLTAARFEAVLEGVDLGWSHSWGSDRIAVSMPRNGGKEVRVRIDNTGRAPLRVADVRSWFEVSTRVPAPEH